MPVGAKSEAQAIEMGAETFAVLRSILKERKDITAVGDEGGFAPNGLKSNEEPLEVLVEAIRRAGYQPGKDICLGMDLASSEFYEPETKTYNLKRSGQGRKTSEEMVAMLEDFVEKYPLITIEDGLSENDWAGWKLLTEKLGKKVQLVGDDLFVTNKIYVKKGIEEGCSNSVLIKLNQIGTLTETLDTCQMAMRNGWTCVVSHRSGETEDTTIADLVVALNAGQIKTGSMSRTDRICKYNQLLRIEEELGDAAQYPGIDAFYNLSPEAKARFAKFAK